MSASAPTSRWCEASHTAADSFLLDCLAAENSEERSRISSSLRQEGVYSTEIFSRTAQGAPAHCAPGALEGCSRELIEGDGSSAPSVMPGS